MNEDTTEGSLPAAFGSRSVLAQSTTLAQRGLALVSAIHCESTDLQNEADLAQEWEDLFAAAGRAAAHGRLHEAERLYRASIHVAQRFRSQDIRLGDSFYGLANVFYQMGALDDAREQYQNALPILEGALGNHPLVGQVHHRLGHIDTDTGLYDSADAHYRETLRVWRTSRGDLHESIAAVHCALGLLYERQGRIEDAEQSYKTAMQVWAQLEGYGAYAARMVFALGELAERSGRRSEATVLYEMALATLEQVTNPSDDDLRTLRYTLARDYKAENRFADAERIYRRELADQEQIVAEGMGVVTVLSRLADLCQREGRFTEAERLYLRAFSLAERGTGCVDPWIAGYCRGLGDLYAENGRLESAEECYRRAVGLYRATQDCYPESRAFHEFSIADCFTALAGLYERQGRLGEALEQFENAMAIFEREPELDADFLADRLLTFGSLLRSMGREEEARRVEERAQGLRANARAM